MKVNTTLVAAICCGVAFIPLAIGDRYIIHVACVVASYWILIAGLNLLVGFAGQLSIGHVGIFALGAYGYTILTGQYAWNPELSLLAAGFMGGAVGVMVGLPSLRLPSFYFAMSTLAFAIVVQEVVVARSDLTGGGAGLAVSSFSAPFESFTGRYVLTSILAVLATLATLNISRHLPGLSLVMVRDSEVAAASVGIEVQKQKLVAFTISGILAGIAGATFAVEQKYITPDTFAFDLGILFFICIIVGGQNSILGPFLGTVLLTSLPEIFAPLARYGGIVYGLALLICVTLVPKGIAHYMTRETKPRSGKNIGLSAPEPDRLSSLLAKVDT
jgi:ABC-type branched-subunit amino acid transport system permease subunit